MILIVGTPKQVYTLNFRKPQIVGLYTTLTNTITVTTVSAMITSMITTLPRIASPHSKCLSRESKREGDCCGLKLAQVLESQTATTHMGGCQNYGPFLGALNIRCRIIIGIQKGTIILTTTHISYRLNSLQRLHRGLHRGTTRGH